MGGFWLLLIDIKVWLYIYILLIYFCVGGGLYDRLGFFLLGLWDWGFLDFVEESYIYKEF